MLTACQGTQSSRNQKCRPVVGDLESNLGLGVSPQQCGRGQTNTLSFGLLFTRIAQPNLLFQ